MLSSAPPFFGSLFYEAFSVTSKWWWWVDKDKRPCLKQDSNPWSQRPSDQGLRLRPRGFITFLKLLSPEYGGSMFLGNIGNHLLV
jgi:hypothetical protein